MGVRMHDLFFFERQAPCKAGRSCERVLVILGRTSEFAATFGHFGYWHFLPILLWASEEAKIGKVLAEFASNDLNSSSPMHLRCLKSFFPVCGVEYVFLAGCEGADSTLLYSGSHCSDDMFDKKAFASNPRNPIAAESQVYRSTSVVLKISNRFW